MRGIKAGVGLNLEAWTAVSVVDVSELSAASRFYGSVLRLTKLSEDRWGGL